MIAAALLLTTAVSVEPPRAAYRNAVLGVPLSEWRKLPFPGDVRPDEKVVLPICTDLRDVGDPPDPILLTSAEKALGVVKCAYYADSRRNLGFLMGSATATYRKLLPIGQDLTMKSVEYSFYQGRLYRVLAIADLAAASDIAEGLASRFGSPSFNEGGTVQNRAGATFPKETKRWIVGPDVIQFDAPGGSRIDTASVMYLEVEVAKIVDGEREKRDPASSKM